MSEQKRRGYWVQCDSGGKNPQPNPCPNNAKLDVSESWRCPKCTQTFGPLVKRA